MKQNEMEIVLSNTVFAPFVGLPLKLKTVQFFFNYFFLIQAELHFIFDYETINFIKMANMNSNKKNPKTIKSETGRKNIF